MFNHSKKNRKNRKNVTKNNIKKIKKKYDTRKVKVKNVKKTRKNLVGGDNSWFVSLLIKSFREYNQYNQSIKSESKLHTLTQKGQKYILIGKNLSHGNPHIHYGSNFMGFPTGSGGDHGITGQKLEEKKTPPSDEDVIDAIETWKKLVHEKNYNTEWNSLFNTMLRNLRNDETPDDDDVDDDDHNNSTPAERDATSNLLLNNVQGIGLSSEDFPLCSSTINNIKTQEYEKKVIKTIKSQINKIEALKIIYTRGEKQDKFVEALLETHLKNLKLDKNKLKTMLKKPKTSKDAVTSMNDELKDLIIAKEFDYMNILYKYLLYRIWCFSGIKKKGTKVTDTKWSFTTTEDEFLKSNIIKKAKSALDTVLKSDRPLYKDFTNTDTLVQLIAEDKLISLKLKPIEYLADYLERNKQYITGLIQK